MIVSVIVDLNSCRKSSFSLCLGLLCCCFPLVRNEKQYGLISLFGGYPKKKSSWGMIIYSEEGREGKEERPGKRWGVVVLVSKAMF